MVSLTRMPDAQTRKGAKVSSWSVPCVACGQARTIRRRQHAERLSRSPCKKCAVVASHPQGERFGIRNSFFNKYRIGSRNRNIPWGVTQEYVASLRDLQGSKCALSGVPLTFTGNLGDITASLDRIDSDAGYVPGNVQWVHKAINMMKGTLSQAAFIAWCEAVAAADRVQ